MLNGRYESFFMAYHKIWNRYISATWTTNFELWSRCALFEMNEMENKKWFNCFGTTTATTRIIKLNFNPRCMYVRVINKSFFFLHKRLHLLRWHSSQTFVELAYRPTHSYCKWKSIKNVSILSKPFKTDRILLLKDLD